MWAKLIDLKNTFEGKFLAVLLSVLLVTSLVNFAAFAGDEVDQAGDGAAVPEQQAEPADGSPAVDEATAPPASAAVEPSAPQQPAAEAPAVPAPEAAPAPAPSTGAVDEAVVTFETDRAFVTVKGQQLTASTLNVPLHEELAFIAAPDDGYEIDSVKAKNAANADVPVATQDGTAKIAPEFVDSTLVITVKAAAVAEEQAPVVETEPLRSDTVIEGALPNAPSSGEADELAAESAAELESDASSPAFEGYAQAGSVLVKVTAPEGALPEGTSVQATQITSSAIIDAVENAVESQGKELETAVAIDVTLVGPSGNVIQPSAAVNVCFFNAGISGETMGVYHVANDGSAVDPVSARQADAVAQSFDVSHFSIYVVTAEGEPRLATYRFFDVEGALVSTQIVRTGDTLYEPKSPAVDGEGRFFEGWFAKNGDAWADKFEAFGEQTVTETASVDLHAKFSEAVYVYFMDNQGRVYTTRQGAPGEQIAADVTFPLGPGEGVLGWYTEQACINKVDSVRLGTADITLYPKVGEGKWLTFDAKGGSYTPPVFLSADEVAYAPAEPTRAGYTFGGWYDNESFEGDAYPFGSQLEADVTLYAKWNPGTASYRVAVWLEAADSTTASPRYDYVASLEYEGVTDKIVDLPDVATLKASVDGFAIDKRLILDEANVQSDREIAVKGDGSALANVYLDRIEYTIDLRCTKKQSSNVDDYSSAYQIIANYGADISAQWSEATSVVNAQFGKRVWVADPMEPGTTANPVIAPFQTMTEDRTLYYVNNGNALHHLELMTEKAENANPITLKDDPSNPKYKKGRKYSNQPGYDSSAFENSETLVFKGSGVHASIDNYVNALNGFEWVGADLANNEGFFQIGSIWTARHYFERKSYTITFNNGNAVSTSDPIKFGTSVADKAVVPAASEAGVPEDSTFGGWYTSPTFAEETRFDFAAATMPANNLVLYAKWVFPTYHVTYYKDMAGTDVGDVMDVAYGETAEDKHFEVPGDYKWVGWMTRAGSEGGYAYTPFNFTTQLYGDVELYPYYIDGEAHTLTYDANGGTGITPTDTRSYVQGSFAEVAKSSLIAPASNQTFLGWNTKPDGTGSMYYPGGMVQIGASDATLYAQWGTPAPKTSLKYVANNGTDASSVIADIVNNDEVVLPSAGDLNFPAPKPGMHFEAWTTAADGSGTSYAAGTAVRVDVFEEDAQNILYAQWAPDPARIVFETNGGSVVPTMEGVSYQPIEDRVLPGTERPGYVFDEWYDNKLLSGEPVSQLPDSYPVGTTTYYAKWIARTDISYTVHYYLKDTEIEVAKSKLVEGQTMDSEVTESAVAVSGYTPIDPTSQTVKLEAEGNVITFYYDADFSQLGATGFDVVYDGAAHKIDVRGMLSTDEDEYWVDGRPLAENTFVNVADSAQVEVRVIRNGITWAETVDAKISKRPISFTGAGWADDQPYTGTEYRKDGFETESANTENTSGLVAGQLVEGLTYLLSGAAVGSHKGAFSGKPSIMAAGVDVTANYNPKMVAGELNIVPSPIEAYVTLATKDVSKIYNGVSLSAGVAQASDKNGNPLKVEYSVDGIDGWTENPADIKATQVSDTKTVHVRASAEGVYAGYVTGEQQLAITPALATIRVSGSAKAFGEDDPAFSGTIEGLFGEDSLGEVAYSRTNDDEAVDDYPGVLTATVDNLNSNYTYKVVPGDFSIVPAGGNTVSIAAEGLVKTYDGQPASVKAEAAKPGSSLLYSLDGTEWLSENPAFTNAGTYPVYVKATNPGYKETPVVKADIVINKAPATVVVADASKVYGAFDPEFSGEVKDLVGSDSLGEVSYLRINDVETAGTYPDVLTATVGNLNPNYTYEVVPGAFIIERAEGNAVGIDAEGLVKTYDGQPVSVIATAAVDGSTLLYSTDGITWSEENPVFTDAGSYPVYVKATNPNYQETPIANATIVINKAPVAITVADASKVYRAEDPAFIGSVVGLVAEGDLGAVTYSRANGDENVGSYPGVLTATYVENANYEVTVTSGAFSITPASAIIRVNDASKAFGESDPDFSGAIEGLFGGDSLGDVSYSRTNKAEEAGKYTGVLTAAVDNLNPNYTYTVVPGDFSIVPAGGNTVIADGLTKTYDGVAASIVASAGQPGSTLLYSLDGITWSEDVPSFTDAGTYPVYVKAANPNFVETPAISANIVINRALATIAVADAAKVAGAADPVLTGTVSGLVQAGDLGTIAYARTNGDEGAGVYADVLTATYTPNANYAVTVIPGTFTITAAPVPAVPATPAAPVPPAPAGPAVPPGTVSPNDPIAPLITPIVEVLEDAATPLAGPQEQEIADNENPLAGFDRVNCWVHYYLILGIILTVLYGAGVLVRRINFTRRLKKREDEVLGIGGEGAAAPAAPVAAEGKEA